MKNNYLAKLILGFILAFSISACQSEQEWSGKYSFDAVFGENAAETPVIVTYELAITGTSCILSIVGYQVADEILCDAKETQNNTLDVLFKSYADGSLTSFYPVQLYQVGERLFSLSGNGAGLETEWGSLIVDNPFSKKGEYFKKQ